MAEKRNTPVCVFAYGGVFCFSAYDTPSVTYAGLKSGEEFSAQVSHPATKESIAREGLVHSVDFVIRCASRMNARQNIDRPLYAYNPASFIPRTYVFSLILWSGAGALSPASITIWPANALEVLLLKKTSVKKLCMFV